tara:strand:+ start:1187 stop:2104 length:918 start_codon:yes stop_codon:yes gene_type:complete
MNIEHNSSSSKNIMLPGFENREMSCELKERHLPDEIFCYPRVDAWQDRMWSMMSDLVTEEVKAEFIRNPPEFLASDDLSWLDEIIESSKGEWYDIKVLTAERIKTGYRAFRMYHSTRTDDLSSFYTHGLKIPNNSEIEDKARVLFLNGQFQSATETTLSEAIDDLNAGEFSYRSDEKARAYCCANERDFLTRSGGSGHYLDFGSEYLFNLGIRLVGKYKAQRTLRTVGRPTIFQVDVPMNLVSSYTVEEFAGCMLEYSFCKLLPDREPYAFSPGAGSGVILRYPIPKEAITGHFHPKKFHHAHQF